MRKKASIPTEHRLSFVVTVWWLFLCLGLGSALLLLGERDAQESRRENRMLQGFPALNAHTLFSGQFMTEFEAYLSDQMFARESLVDISTNCMYVFSSIPAEELLLVDEDLAIGMEMSIETSDEPSLVTTDEFAQTQLFENMDADYIPLEQYELRVLKHDGTYDVAASYTPQDIEKFMVGLRHVADALPEDGQVHVALVHNSQVPNLLIFESDVFCGLETNAEEYLAALAPDNIHIYNAMEIFEPHLLAGEYVYCRTDGHWTPYGASLLCSAMMEAQGYPAISYEDYRYKTYHGSLGSIYRQNPTAALRAMADDLDILYPNFPVHSYVISAGGQREIEFNNYSSTEYGELIHGTQPPWRRFQTGNYTGRSALLIGDSFCHAFVTYLIGYYDEVHFVDLRANRFSPIAAGGTARQLIEKYGVDDAYVILSKSSGLSRDYASTFITQYFRP